MPALDKVTSSTRELGHSTATRGSWRRALSGLQCRATVLVAALTLAVTGGASGYLLRYSGRLVRAEQEAHLLLAASLLADAVAPSLEVGALDQLTAVADHAVNATPLMCITVANADRAILVSAGKSATGAPAPARAIALPADGPPGVRVVPPTGKEPPILEVTYPIRRRGVTSDQVPGMGAALLGYVRVGVNADHWERSMASRLDLLIGVGMIATLIVIPLGFVLVRRFVAPVESLADVMARFAGGNLDVRSHIDRRDEIGRLARAFNQMAEQHRTTHHGLLRLNVELEERVASRTRQLREIASREPLTGLYNRRHFNEVLHRRFAEAQRYDTELSCIMIDLDGFKHANDAFGHHVGDELLVLTAATILSQLRTADVAARYGGDEFVLLLPQTDANRAEVLADRIMQKFSRDADQRVPGTTVSMSVGIGTLRAQDLRDADGLVRAADQAMYQAKAAGKNRIVGPRQSAATRAG